MSEVAQCGETWRDEKRIGSRLATRRAPVSLVCPKENAKMKTALVKYFLVAFILGTG
jgi:hypothetical protein